MRQAVFNYIKKKYRVSPAFPWRRSPDSAVFRHDDNKKWFALVMAVPGDRVGLSGKELVDVINLKIDDLFYRDMLIAREGIMPAYHMNKMHWISVLLDGSVEENQVFDLLDLSYAATASRKKKEKSRPPKEWVIPSNPKYYDIARAFERQNEIDWKQGAGIKKGDTVFMYAGAPISAILYQCLVTETNIPYHYQDKNLTITALMRIKLLKRYPPDRFTFETLKSCYGIYAVRGPRGIPNSLSADLAREGLQGVPSEK